MELNTKKLKGRILSPLSIINITFIFFCGASIYQLVSLDIIMGQFYSINNAYGLYQVLVIIFFVFSVNVIYLVTPAFNLLPRKIVVSNVSYNSVIFSVMCVFFVVIVLFNDKYLYFNYLEKVFFSRSITDSYVVMAEFGYDIINSGGLFYYTVLYFFPLFVFSLSLNSRNRYNKIVFVSFSVLLILLYSMAGRREILLVIPIIAVLSSKDNNYLIIKVFLSCFLFSILAVILLMARVKADSFDLSLYLNTQEFYPYTYGSYLTVEKLKFFDYEEFKRLFPFYVFNGEDNLSFLTRKEHFNYSDHGPTVTLLYPLVAFFPISIFLFMAVISQLKFLHGKIFSDNKVEGSNVILYSFLIIKLFVLVRNGEFGLFFWDVILFVLLLSPVLFLKRKNNYEYISDRSYL